MFVDGVALLYGYDVDKYDDLHYTLLLDNENEIVTLPLAKSHAPRITKEMFDGEYMTIYDKAVFTTYQYKGVDISSVPSGVYKMLIEIHLPSYNIRVVKEITAKRQLGNIEINGFRVFQDNGLFYLSITK